MKITLVGNRQGRAVIHWPGVLLSSLIVTLLYAVGVVAFSAAFEWFSPLSFLMLPLALASVVGRGVRCGLQLPAHDLPVIN